MEDLMQERIKRLNEIKSVIMLGGGKEKIEKAHQQGKLSGRERIDCLLDPGSFVEWNMLTAHLDGLPGDGIIVGHGTIDGRVVCVYAQDPTVAGGSMGPLHGIKQYHTIERALQMKVPVICLNDSPGVRVGRLEGGALSRGGVVTDKTGGAIYFPNTEASGVIPQISAMLGTCAGITCYASALMDFIFMVDGISHMFITGPRIIKSVMSEEISAEELGGAKIHCRVSGVADFRIKNELECFQAIKKLLSFLPSNNEEASPVVDTGDDPDRLDENLAELVPSESSRSYDMRKVIKRLVDSGDFFEVKAEFAPEMIVGFGRLDSRTVGFVANQPMVRAGALTADSSDKEARFIRFCDAFNIPIILLVDTTGYMPGSQQERAGIIRHGAKVLYALCEAVVPRISVTFRKIYGGATTGMGARPGIGTDFIFKWPIAEGGGMGPAQSVDLFYAKEIAEAENPAKYREEKIREYREKYANPLIQVSGNPFEDDVIEPKETRLVLIRSLRLMRNKKVTRYPKRHGNMPM